MKTLRDIVIDVVKEVKAETRVPFDQQNHAKIKDLCFEFYALTNTELLTGDLDTLIYLDSKRGV